MRVKGVPVLLTPMTDDPRGVVAQLQSDADISPEFFVSLHRELTALGWERIRTNAVAERFADAARDAGFVTAQRLVLLERPRLTVAGLASDGDSAFVVHATTYHGSSPRMRRMLDACARIDASSFPATWSLDARALRDAAAATPRHRFFTVTATHGDTDDDTDGNADDDALSGYLLCGADSTHGFIQRLAVHPRQRARGIARELLARSLGWLGALGVRSAWVNTEPDNAAALHLYLGTGFQRHATGLVVVERAAA
jgi:ribosomal protein S18 acetylase RimI-like enzyme